MPALNEEAKFCVAVTSEPKPPSRSVIAETNKVGLSVLNRIIPWGKPPRNYLAERKLIRYSFTLFENG
jgi:hypothetical protein